MFFDCAIPGNHLYYSINRFIRIEYHINPKNSVNHIQRRTFTYCDSFVSHQKTSQDIGIVLTHDLDCIPLDLLLMVKKPENDAHVVWP